MGVKHFCDLCLTTQFSEHQLHTRCKIWSGTSKGQLELDLCTKCYNRFLNAEMETLQTIREEVNDGSR